MTPHLTIAIPFYRGQAYLRAAIESVLRQTSPEWILLVSDDCGPDSGTEELVGSYRDPRIRYSRNPVRLGMAGNWNRCLDFADTELVTLLHADDELRPTYVEMMSHAASHDPTAVAVFCAADIIGPNGNPVFSLADFVKRFLWRGGEQASAISGRTGIEALCLGNFLMCPTACYRKSHLGTRRFSDRWRFVLDLEFFSRLLFDGEHFHVLPDRLYAYRRHGENATESYTQSLLRFREESDCYDALAAAARQRGWRRAAHRAKAKVLLKLHLLVRATHDVCHGRLHAAGQKLGFLLPGGNQVPRGASCTSL